MKVNIVIESLTKSIIWDYPYFPNIGHKMYLEEFIGTKDFEKYGLSDSFNFIITDIIWAKSEGYPKVDIFLKKIK